MAKRLLYGSLYLLCFLSVSFFSCKKSLDTVTGLPANSFPIPASTPISAGLAGRVVNENDQPVESAMIDCGGVSVSTDVNGIFYMPSVTLDKYISTVTVTKAGYFKGYRSFSATEATNYVNIKLIPKALAGTIDANAGGTISLANTTAISFQPNSLVIKSSGAVFSGNANVYAAYIDPTRADISTNVPGSLLGRDENSLYSLQSAGMLAIEIASGSGEPLQLATNKPANVKLAIPSSITTNAPSTIATWSLNEQGVWEKEGTAIKTGTHYEFEASHFSFWNADIPNLTTFLSIHMQDTSATPLAYQRIRLTQSTFLNSPFYFSYGTTDNLGNVSGFVPIGDPLLLEANPDNYNCVTAAYSKTIGPFTTSSSITISATWSSTQVLNFTGLANNCSGQPLPDGIATIFSGQYLGFATISNGVYSGQILYCSNPINDVTAIIRDDSPSGFTQINSIPVINNVVNFPTVAVCQAGLNPYDGIYEVSGTFVDHTNPAFVVGYPKQFYLITKSATSLIIGELINGTIDPGYLFNSAGAGSYYQNFGLEITMDPLSQTIAEMHNYYGDPTNPMTAIGNPALGTGAPDYWSTGPSVRKAVLNSAGLNDYDPILKIFHVKYGMIQNTYLNGTSPRAEMDETWTYTGPR